VSWRKPFVRKDKSSPNLNSKQILWNGYLTLDFLDHDTKVFELIELYFLNKSLIAQVIEEKGQQQEVIIQQLNLLHINFDAVCKIVFNVEIIVLDHTAD
jgi:hypothetical protein